MVKENIMFQDMSNSRGEGVVYGLFDMRNKVCLIGSSGQKNHNWMQSYKGRVSNYLAYLRKGTFNRYPQIQDAYDMGRLHFQPVIRCNKTEKYYYEALMANHFKDLGWTVLNEKGWNKLECKTRTKKESMKIREVMGKSQSGEKNGNNKHFKDDEIRLIRKLYEEDGMTCKELAKAYDVSKRYMQEILCYRKYTNV